MFNVLIMNPMVLVLHKNTAFIVTQYPPPEDAVDFLRLLNDHASDTVMFMNHKSEIQSVVGRK